VSAAQQEYRGPGCPRCWTPLPPAVLGLGNVHCGECALDFTAAVFQPALARPVSRPEDAPSGGASCARHARNAAVAACERCGAFMCPLCRVEVEGKALCAACFDRGRNEGSLHAAQTTFRSWRTLGLHLSLAGVLMYPLGILIGPASLYATIRGISQARKDGDEGGALGTVAAIVLALFVMVASGFFLLAMAGVFSRLKAH
jgi:hypothetical protein